MTAVEQALDPPAPVDAEAAPARAGDAPQRETEMRETSLVGRIRAWLPEGGSLPEEAWWQRHRVLLVIIALHVPAIVIFAVVRGYGFRHGLLETSVVAAFGLLAIPRRRGSVAAEGADGDAALLSRKRRRLHAAAAGLALLSCSAILVHLSGGLIEMHFHFFVVIGLMTLYQDWQPFLLAIAFVAVHHGVMGTLYPTSVYDHLSAQQRPWLWALIHAGFVLASSGTFLAAWKLNEQARSAEQESYRRLGASEERYRSVVNACREVVFQTDGRGRWTFLSPAWTTITGEPVVERLGCPAGDSVHPDDRARVVGASREDGELEFRLVTPGGAARTVETRWRSLSDAEGRFAGTSGTIHDVTDRRRLEAELIQAQRLESVGRLAAGIAHEINTPVQYVGDNVQFLSHSLGALMELLGDYRAVLGESGSLIPEASGRLLADREEAVDMAYLEAEMPDAIGGALDGIQRVTSIVRAMRRFGYTDSERGPLDLNELVANTLTVARGEYRHLAEVETEFGNLPPVSGYRGDLGQVFLNLIVNAAHAIADRDAGGPGRIRVRTWSEHGAAFVAVEDNGCGIPSDVEDKIFEQFFTTKEVGRGTGQGLALARAIVVNKHAGQLTFTSRAGRGTTFFVSLPVTDVDRAAESLPA
ncbi:MAG TPA: ATP-binding protein [Actinomycetota bacterium]|jgi:PAS domain S-box-containing protein|nr:ATP-binding protein [Actinomycetota bacterium]